MRGFYEPLHEGVARLRRADIGALRPGAWRSNHDETPPYFEEYRALIPPSGCGVPGYAPRFAFEGFFMQPETEDPALEDYLAGLLRDAQSRAEVPVLKFCRSLGRVAWFENHFPHALHAVVLRDPASQFLSAQRLLQQTRNRYFLVAPLLVLARNAQAPCVREACCALGVRLPRLHSPDLAYGIETIWRHVKRQDADERYRGFLAFWTLSALSALRGGALLIDMTQMAQSPAHRLEISALLGARLGSKLCLVPRLQAEAALPAIPGMAAAHGAAAALAEAQRGSLRADRLDSVLSHLIDADRSASFAPPAQDTRQPVCTAAAVAYARALQPVRRLHGKLVKNVLF